MDVPPIVETALGARAIIGESPLWCAAEQALYWIDIKALALHRFEPRNGGQRSWALSSDVGGFALLGDPPGALVALRYGLHRLDFATGALSLLAPSPFDPKRFRFNEGACDAQGRFWIGVMFDPPEPGGETEKAPLHCCTPGGGLRALPDLSDLHNGMAWSADGGAFNLAHSHERQILAYPFNAKSGKIGKSVVFATLPEALGILDGAADRDILLPVSQPTQWAFGGADLDELYVTSARGVIRPSLVG